MGNLPYCCNCNPDRAVFSNTGYPYLCTRCESDPCRLSLLDLSKNLLSLVDVGEMSNDVFSLVMARVCDLKRRCDTNPAPVVIGLIFTELYEDGGKVLLVKRAIEPAIGGWALVSGFIIDTLTWQNNLRKEALEEASVTLSTEPQHMYPFSFVNNEPRTNLILNVAVVLPSGVVRIHDFAPDHETADRMEFRFSLSERPPFCFPIHTVMFDRFCSQHFGW